MNVLDGVMSSVEAFADPRLQATILGAATIAVAVCLVRMVLHRRDARAGRRAARLVIAAAPPEVDPEGAISAWRHLAQIERSAWRRFWRGQPHLVFEYAFTGPGLQVRVWVPGTVSVPVVRHALAAAWPGAATTVIDVHEQEEAT